MQNPANGKEAEFDYAFLSTVDIMRLLMKRLTMSIANKHLGEAQVRNAINAHLQQDGGPILVLDEHAESWQTLVCQLDPFKKLLYAVFQAPDGTWMVQQVPQSESSFEGRKPLPESWAGLRDEELSATTKVADAVFCHRGRFICGAKSKEGALALARLAVLA